MYPTDLCFSFFIILFVFIVDSAGSSLLPGLFSSSSRHGLPPVAMHKLSLQGLPWWSTGSGGAGVSSCGSLAVEHRLGSCGAQASLLCGAWDLP